MTNDSFGLDIPKSSVNKYFEFPGSTDRYWIQPLALKTSHVLGETYGLNKETLLEVDTMEKALVAEEIARYFHLETNTDFAPFIATEKPRENETVFLIPSHDIISDEYVFILGACGVLKVKDLTIITWIWIHPFHRGKRKMLRKKYMLDVWKELESKYGDLSVSTPVSREMSSFIKKHRPETKGYSVP